MWKTALVRISNICMSIEKSNCKLWPEFVTFLNFYILDAAALGATILSIQWIRNWRVWLQKLQRGKCSLRCWCWSVEILKSFYPQLHKRQSSPDFERILCSWIKDNYPHNHFLPTGEEVEAPCVNFRGENVPCATHVGGNLHYHQQNDDEHIVYIQCTRCGILSAPMSKVVLVWSKNMIDPNQIWAALTHLWSIFLTKKIVADTSGISLIIQSWYIWDTFRMGHWVLQH